MLPDSGALVSSTVPYISFLLLFCSVPSTSTFVPFHSHILHGGPLTTMATSPSSSPSTASSSGGSLNAAAAASMLLSPSENVYETAAKLLFMCVRWAKSIPSYNQLSQRDQAALLEDGWCQLFVLSLAQWNVQVDEGEVTTCTGLGKRVVPRVRELSTHGQRESGGGIHAT